ncbi:SusC/RagA family TonB-linked outer membrane protein [Flavihumibacter petaseus]|uniref:Putative TonB-dependent receptor n=1 Tax=Flavihumibacter petaseus NBRC 106054 TaxID=1220578 RepID=A0A0E9MYB8_9BACT|nr:SusC/RagA family TonB-linked outer membrane protein [Flavihumibacter petaseus]GAO42125.1 putative TonB-dependent receptor [Flavihumibacter petaseus NBRC 106054]
MGLTAKGSNRRRLLILMTLYCLSFLFMQTGFAQTPASTHVVTGKVKNAEGNPLPMVTITESGKQNVTVTDDGGNFSIKVSDGQSVLVFTAVGFATLEIPVKGQTSINIKMDHAVSNLDDVVVIGYGKQKKKEVTSAIASVKREDFTQGFARDAGQLIQGKVAGLAVVNPSGDPNATTQISLRGNATMFASTEPLVLVDGIPGYLNTVAPEDIESIDVLKDGSAAAIYGTRGTNGVILITTRKKSGGSGASMMYDGYFSVQTIARKMEFLTADDARKLVADGFYDPTLDYDKGTSTDWLDVITRTPLSQNHNLTLQGGNAQTNYVASLNYRDWQGLFLRSDNRQFTGRIDLNHSMFNNKLRFNLNVVNRNRKYFAGPNYAYTYRQAIIRNPTDSVYDYTGNYKEDPNGYNYDNPLRTIKETDGEYRVSELRLNGNVIFSPIRDLNIKLLVSGVKRSELSGYAESFNHKASVVNSRTGYASRNTSLYQDNLLEFTTDYSKIINKNRFTVLGGYSYQDVTSEGFGASNSNFPTDLYSYNRLQAGDALLLQNSSAYGMNSYKSNSKLIGFFGRINYAFDEKYLLMASLRYEGSSKFGENYKWGTFPAASVGWRIKKEDFMRSVDFVSDLKLRVGYGVTGTVPTDPYLSLISLNYDNTSRFLYNGTWIQPISPVRNPNPNLRWEKKQEFNVGLDYGFFGNRLNGSIDFYQRDTKDMLYDFPVPVPPNLNGFTLANAGSMRNRGLEILMNYDVIRTKDVDFKINATYSSNTNELLSISAGEFKTEQDFFPAGYTGEPIQEATHIVKVGEPIGNFYGYKSIDIDENGEWIIEDADGKPKKISANSPNDKKVLGNGIPKHNAGVNLYGRYKHFDLSINMRGAFGYQILNFQRMYYENPKIKSYNMLKSALDDVYGKGRLNSDLAYVSYYIEDGDHWKIDNVTLGYNIDVTGSKVFKRARVYASALNLLVLTGYKGIDPEVNRIGLSPGNDERDKYPTTRTFTLGVSLGF